MPDSAFPQCRIVPLRLLSPETTELLLNQVAGVPGVRRAVINGPALPATVPYGPARGTENPNTNRRTIQVRGTEFEMRVQTGMVTLEVEDDTVVEKIRTACDEVFTAFPYTLQTGRQFMKSQASLVDYAKYGPNADEFIIGLTDPRRKDSPVIIPTATPDTDGGRLSDQTQTEHTSNYSN
ncbi:methyl-coenzyme M reductase operon protein D [Methanofollis formosanus]|uniref:Methyl-coenzyme M reductase operon protein D n=1 Tax=Methanofollis formosanus TaxID=299308 RepID=A0A8G1EFY5_9EURY|nr:methyl-coenzyme M reductase operon protein D [Methanofollis formosanus]QYZ78614.1 methyl-coenzyme M reductase operon protein D [Methanofollis formosanus]